MAFGDKLRRLRDLPPPGGRAPDAPAPEPSSAVAVPEGEATDERSRVLAELRLKMSAILRRPAPSPPRADPSATCLPFACEERASGLMYRRLERLAPSHHVGRMPVDAAAAARGEILALLALDPALSAPRFERALFLDTETTGLGGAGVLPFLVGMCWFDEERRPHLEQLLARRPGDEPAMLERVRECVEAAEVIVTYNGKTFDWPLLATRCVMNRMPQLPERPHLDLLHVARRLHRARLGACRLVSLESAVLGFERGPDVEGKDVAARYAHFLRTGDESALEAVVSHNAWDVVSMAALVGLYGEPLELLPAEDLVGMARTFRRAGALARAEAVAEAALSRGGGAGARRVRAEIAKARGDKARALADLEAIVEEVDEPALRLELAKLYEHFVQEPLRALALVDRGTGESEAATERRRARLERKAQRERKARRG
ncbi:MAG TPA: ribonuclease H-like domain-containing protein [Polyangiaceae bacterium]|nr:ribonuclease H-like domain-containing protein [Polyangiaceae bacterium]